MIYYLTFGLASLLFHHWLDWSNDGMACSLWVSKSIWVWVHFYFKILCRFNEIKSTWNIDQACLWNDLFTYDFRYGSMNADMHRKNHQHCLQQYDADVDKHFSVVLFTCSVCVCFFSLRFLLCIYFVNK